ncbi:hypothetical protein [Marinobacter sp. X15-166B]|uniref:hypothetical protein n=1 Tax=Marinobacter sp. X15-166B TaxID=1897620 RepID=UPI0013017CC7|nr:hypothetical protein [Marinobacter sp. X15-166B]
MHSKPDIIRTLLLVFVIGLAVTGVTSLQVTVEDERRVGAVAVTPSLNTAGDD